MSHTNDKVERQLNRVGTALPKVVSIFIMSDLFRNYLGVISNGKLNSTQISRRFLYKVLISLACMFGFVEIVFKLIVKVVKAHCASEQ